MELQTIWSWQPALYLFLGGMGAARRDGGGAVPDRPDASSPDRVRVDVGCASQPCGGLLLLLSELVTPLRGLLMWQSFGHSPRG